MSAFKITNITSLDEYNSQSISYYLNSLELPFGRQENFLIMEKTPDYVFQYMTLYFYKHNLQTKYELSFSKKKINEDIAEITIDSNHTEAFKFITQTLKTIENHFLLIIEGLYSLDTLSQFLEKLEKLNLFDKLNNKLSEENNLLKIPKNKI